MAKERIIANLPETKGTFQIKGIVTGAEKDNFYTEKKTKTGKDFRAVSFGLEAEKDKTTYVSLNGMPREKVYFYKAGKDGAKGETLAVDWAQRHTFNREGFRPLGINIGVTKVLDEKGNMVNDKKTLVEFDACRAIGEHVKDGVSLFIRGNMEYSSFKDDKGNVRRSTKLIPSQVSLCADVDFAAADFKPVHDFQQVIVFKGIDQEMENDSPTGRFVVGAYIITYSTIEEAEFIIVNKTLAQQFKKNIKPYSVIKVWGHMETTIQTEEVSSDDVWGESNAMEKVSSPVKRDIVITGADPNSIDSTIYSEELIAEGIMKINNAKNATADFGDAGNASEWGSPSLDAGADDEEVW